MMEQNQPKIAYIFSDCVEKRCVWMAAGIISFKLCPYNFECEDCDFNTVMCQKTHDRGTLNKRASTN